MNGAEGLVDRRYYSEFQIGEAALQTAVNGQLAIVIHEQAAGLIPVVFLVKGKRIRTPVHVQLFGDLHEIEQLGFPTPVPMRDRGPEGAFPSEIGNMLEIGKGFNATCAGNGFMGSGHDERGMGMNGRAGRLSL